mmetsp:Transcript_71052/g.201367  ORF Transcript_71052/g.201367 Transcript_71052/m.201367 type:complete len:225 (+) Transcript_71052:692-1366(+)
MEARHATLRGQGGLRVCRHRHRRQRQPLLRPGRLARDEGEGHHLLHLRVLLVPRWGVEAHGHPRGHDRLHVSGSVPPDAAERLEGRRQDLRSGGTAVHSGRKILCRGVGVPDLPLPAHELAVPRGLNRHPQLSRSQRPRRRQDAPRLLGVRGGRLARPRRRDGPWHGGRDAQRRGPRQGRRALGNNRELHPPDVSLPLVDHRAHCRQAAECHPAEVPPVLLQGG